jgi:hypothetical protein
VFFHALDNVIANPNIERAIRTLNHVTKPRPVNLFGHKNLAESGKLFHFLVSGMLPASIAELGSLQPLGVLPAVLGRRVVPVLTIVAL